MQNLLPQIISLLNNPRIIKKVEVDEDFFEFLVDGNFSIEGELKKVSIKISGKIEGA